MCMNTQKVFFFLTKPLCSSEWNEKSQNAMKNLFETHFILEKLSGNSKNGTPPIKITICLLGIYATGL